LYSLVLSLLALQAYTAIYNRGHHPSFGCVLFPNSLHDANVARAALIAAEQASTAQAARAAALAQAEEAEREAAVAQADHDATAARLRAAQERAAAERAASAPSTEDDDADASHHGDGGIDNLPLQDTLLQQEAAILLNLHAQAVSVQNIRTLVPLLLDVNSTFYAR